MALEDRLDRFEDTLQEHSKMLSDIKDTLAKIAVQDERIRALEAQNASLWRKYDALVDPQNGTITAMAAWQASCPRNQVKAMWSIIIPMGLVLIGMAIRLVM